MRLFVISGLIGFAMVVILFDTFLLGVVILLSATLIGAITK